jgi:hypothetical protein
LQTRETSLSPSLLLSGNDDDLFVFHRARVRAAVSLLAKVAGKNGRLRRQFVMRCRSVRFTNRSRRLPALSETY